MDYFQDCSVFHSEKLKIGVPFLQENHMAWVLSSWQIQKNRMPELGEHVAVQTWAYGVKGFYGYRNFSMNAQSGERLVYANSVWVLMDTKAGRPVRVPEEMIARYGLEPQLEMDYAKRKIELPEELTVQRKITVPGYFIDTNHHMNNGKYVLLAQECLPPEFVIRAIRVEYKKAAKQGDTVVLSSAGEENRFVVRMADETGKLYAVVEFE